MSDIYVMFRKFIGDDVVDYSMPDLETFKFLDSGINKLSEIANRRIIEDITITSTDITNGYIDLSNNCISIYETDLPYENQYWGLEGDGKRIRFWDTSYISAGTYTFNYKSGYKTFDGQLRDNSYFDYPRSMDLGIVFWALAQYQAVNGIITPDGSRNAIVSKSEEGLSESYSSSETIELSNSQGLEDRAIAIFKGLNSKSKFVFSVTV